MSQLQPRRLTQEEAPAFARTLELSFGDVATEQDLAAIVAEDFDENWAIGVYDGADLVATACATPLELALPAAPGRPLPVLGVAGVAGVGVLPTHRRRGLLSQMMAYQLAQFREREIPVAILTASESVIYGRFGYGLASSYQSLEIATKRSAFRELPYLALPGEGQVRIMGKDEAAKVLPGLHAEARLLRPGEIDRTEARWTGLLDDPERHRQGASTRMYVVHEDSAGKPDGYASYRSQYQADGPSRGHRVVVVEDIYSLVAPVQARLWRYLLDLDLIEELRCGKRPTDEALRWMLADPRQLRTIGMGDMLWARLVDVPAALAARGYATSTGLVLEVRGANERPKRYRLETGPQAADCRHAKAGEKTDLVLGLGDLAAVYLGGCPPSVLARAGRVEEARPGALARADAAFNSACAPFCGTHF